MCMCMECARHAFDYIKINDVAKYRSPQFINFNARKLFIYRFVLMAWERERACYILLEFTRKKP